MQTPQTAPRDVPAQQRGAQGTRLQSGQDVTSLMSGQDVTSLFNQTQATPPPSQAPPKTFNDSLIEFAQGVGSQVNPVTLLTGLWGAVTSPIETAKNIGQAQLDQFKNAKKAYDEGRYSEAYGHTMAGIIPLLGPQAAEIGQKIGSGEVARGLGEATGMLGMIGAPAAVRGSVRAVSGTGLAEDVAARAEGMSTRRMVDVMAPKGASSTVKRLSNTAADIAPEIAAWEGLGARSRLGLQRKVGEQLSRFETELDAAADARNPGHAYPTAPIISELRRARTAMTAEAVEGSRPTPAYQGPGGRPIGVNETFEGNVTSRRTTDPLPDVNRTGRPIGQDVVPAPNRARVAQIDQAISELEQLGPVARYEAIRRIRASYDQVAKVKYSPSMTADFLAKNSEASGAADVTRVLRQHLADIDPQTAAANRGYTLFRRASDVMEAAEEIDRAKPAIGRKIASRFAGGVVGGAASGGTGAAIGVIIGPVVDELLNAGPTMKVSSARALQGLADALRGGNADAAISALARARGIAMAVRAMPKSEEKEREP